MFYPCVYCYIFYIAQINDDNDLDDDDG